jgi:hypothetical protein
MTIVARWLRERDANDGRLIYLNGPIVSPESLSSALKIGSPANQQSANRFA